MTLQELYSRIEGVRDALHSGEIPRLAVLPYGDDILTLQKEQLAEGQSASGEDLRPYYSEDLKTNGGYFHSGATAANYAAWKQSISNPYGGGNRKPDAPNLYITGKFYDEIGVQFGADAAVIVPLTPFASQVMAKYGRDSFGLTMARWNEIMARGAYARVMDEIRKRIYG